LTPRPSPAVAAFVARAEAPLPASARQALRDTLNAKALRAEILAGLQRVQSQPEVSAQLLKPGDAQRVTALVTSAEFSRQVDRYFAHVNGDAATRTFAEYLRTVQAANPYSEDDGDQLFLELLIQGACYASIIGDEICFVLDVPVVGAGLDIIFGAPTTESEIWNDKQGSAFSATGACTSGAKDPVEISGGYIKYGGGWSCTNTVRDLTLDVYLYRSHQADDPASTETGPYGGFEETCSNCRTFNPVDASVYGEEPACFVTETIWQATDSLGNTAYGSPVYSRAVCFRS